MTIGAACREGRGLDIACVGTPDHMHAPMAMAAMQRGLHVYVQKPLAHNIHEVCRGATMARRKKLSLRWASDSFNREYRTTVALIRSGAVGKVKEVHSWSDKTWGDTGPRPDRTDAVPPTLNWDVWLGVAEPRPYLGGTYYHPANWRKRLDFGTATFGDMGCHILDPVFDSLRLKSPLSVRCESSAPNQYNWALNTVIHYVFPAPPSPPGNVSTSHGATESSARPRKSWRCSVRANPQRKVRFLSERKASCCCRTSACRCCSPRNVSAISQCRRSRPITTITSS